MCLLDCRKIKCNNPVYVYKMLRVVDTKPFSPYQDFEWKEGETMDTGYTSEDFGGRKFIKEIYDGFFHSFEHKESTLLLLNDFFFRPEDCSFAVGKFEIPAGSTVYEGTYCMVLHDGSFCKMKSYASNRLKFLGYETFDYKEVLERRKSEGVYWE